MIKKLTNKDVQDADQYTFGQLVREINRVSNEMRRNNYAKHFVRNDLKRRSTNSETKCGVTKGKLVKLQKMMIVKNLQQKGVL